MYVCAPDVCVALRSDFQYPRGSEASLGAAEGRGWQITPYNAGSKNSELLPSTGDV